jgi:ribokinase
LSNCSDEIVAGSWVTFMGSFVADLAFRTESLAAWGQTVMGSEFRLGPGGKGSNQAVAAARLGARVNLITKLGRDYFGDLARETYRQEGIDTEFSVDTAEHATGAAAVIVHASKGENAIVVVPGSGFRLAVEDVDRAATRIAESALFVTQLEVPIPAVERGLQLARDAGVATVFNPAPAAGLPERLYTLCDYFTPNEYEAAALIGRPVRGIEDANRAADIFLARGAGNVVITLGAQGAFVKNARIAAHVPAFNAGPVAETTGAGDAFNGALAVGLSEGLDLIAAARLGCAAAGISVTRFGTSLAMPTRSEVDALLQADRTRNTTMPD